MQKAVWEDEGEPVFELSCELLAAHKHKNGLNKPRL
jgi:hypothetical protein